MNIEKDNFFVITGGPSGGKTSVLNAQAEKGFACVRESATQMIKERLEKAWLQDLSLLYLPGNCIRWIMINSRIICQWLNLYFLFVHL